MENFILQEFIDDINICDELIEYYNKSDNKQKGLATVNKTVNESVKKCNEILINPENSILNEYLLNLRNVTSKYINKYEWCNKQNPWSILEYIKIQHYQPNEGYFVYHNERDYYSLSNLTRHLVWITYLNDVEDGGETEFLYQNIKIKPKKGLTIIFPADWTHTHRGITSKTQEKYIITGWFNYINQV